MKISTQCRYFLPAGFHAVGHGHQYGFDLADPAVHDLEYFPDDEGIRLRQSFVYGTVVVEITHGKGKPCNGIGDKAAFPDVGHNHRKACVELCLAAHLRNGAFGGVGIIGRDHGVFASLAGGIEGNVFAVIVGIQAGEITVADPDSRIKGARSAGHLLHSLG